MTVDEHKVVLTADTSQYRREWSRAVSDTVVGSKRIRDAVRDLDTGVPPHAVAALDGGAGPAGNLTKLASSEQTLAGKIGAGAGKILKKIPLLRALDDFLGLGNDPLTADLFATPFDPNDAVDAYLLLLSDVEQRL